MKTRLISWILTLAMLFSLGSPAYAVEPEGTETSPEGETAETLAVSEEPVRGQTALDDYDNELIAWPKDYISYFPVAPHDYVVLEVEVSALDMSGITYNWEVWSSPYYDEPAPVETDIPYRVSMRPDHDVHVICTVEDAYGNSVEVDFEIHVDNEFRLDALSDQNVTVAPHADVPMEVVPFGHDLEGVTYRWELYDAEDEIYRSVDGATEASYTLENVTANSDLQCWALDAYDNKDFCSFSIYINNEFSVEALDDESLFTVAPHADVPMEVVPFGHDLEGVTYQWELYDSTAEDYLPIAGATAASYTLQNVTTLSDLRCRVTDAYGNMESCAFTVYIDNAFYIEEPNDLYSFTVAPHKNVTMGVVPHGNDLEGVTYQWELYDNAAGEYLPIAGATAASYTLENVTVNSDLRCRAADAYGNEGSCSFTVYLDNEPGIKALNDQTDFTVAPHEAVTMGVVLLGHDLEGATYQWKLYDEDEQTYLPIEGATASTYTLADPTKACCFECTACDAYGNEEWLQFRVYIDNQLTAWAMPDTWVQIPVHGSYTMEVGASANDEETIRYQWRILQTFHDEEGDFDYTSWVPVEGETQSAYTYVNALENVSVSCLVSDAYGSEAEVVFSINITNDFRIHAKDGVDSVFAAPGSSVTLEVETEGYELGNATYQWSVERTFHNEEGDYDYTEWVPVEGATADSYTLESVSEFLCLQCEAWDGFGAYSSVVFTVSVGNDLYAHAKDDVDSFYAAPGGSVTLEVEVSALDMEGITYQWYEYRSVYHEDSGEYWDEWVTLDGETGSTLALSDIRDFTQVFCRVCDAYQNEYDVTFWVYLDNQLQAQAKDGITEYYVVPGENLTLELEVSALDMEGITYQWYKYDSVYDPEGDYLWDEYVPIAGETGSTLTLSNIREYTCISCRIRDAYQNVVSVGFDIYIDNQLDVHAKDGIDTFSVAPGESLTLELEVSALDMAGVTLQWYKLQSVYNEESGEYEDDWVRLEGETGSTLALSDIRYYTKAYCDYSDNYGNWGRVNFWVNIDNQLEAQAKDEITEYYVAPGGSVTLEVEVSALDTEGISFQWYKSTTLYNEEGGYYYDDWTVLEGETGRTIALSDIREFTKVFCRVSDAYHNDVDVTFGVHIDNQFEAQAKDNIQNFYVAPGGSVTLEVEVSALDTEGITYQWYEITALYDEEGGYYYDNWITLEGETGSTLALSDIRDYTRLSCRIYDAYQNETSVTFWVYIDNQLEAHAKDDIDSFNVSPGESVTLEVEVSALDTEGISCQWYEVTTLYDEEGGYYYDVWTKLEGEMNSSYTATADAYRQFVFRVLDVYSNSADVWFRVYIENELSVEPVDGRSVIFASLGDRVVLEAAAHALDETQLSFTWQKSVYDEENGYSWSAPIEGADTASFVIESLEEFTQYRVTVRDRYENTVDLVFTVSPDPRGGAVELTLDEKLSSQLQDENEAGAYWFSFTPEEACEYVFYSYAGEGMYLYNASLERLNDGYWYEMELSHRLYQDLDAGETYYLKIFREFEPDGGATVKVRKYFDNGLWVGQSEESNTMVSFGEDAFLKVEVNANDLNGITYSWYRIAIELNDEGVPCQVDYLIEGADSDSYTVENVTYRARYRCDVVDAYDNKVEVTFTVGVENHFSAAPKDGKETILVTAGEDAPLEVELSGDDLDGVSFQWYVRQEDEYGGYEYVAVEGANTASFTVENLTESTDVYCLVRDRFGTEYNLWFYLRIDNNLSASAVDGVLVYSLQAGDSLTLKVAAAADDLTGIVYEWFDGDTGEDFEGGDGAVLTLNDVTHNCRVICRVTDCYSNIADIQFLVFVDLVDLTLYEETSAVIANERGLAYFRFVPEETGEYIFQSLASEDTDTCAYLYDADFNELAYNDDGGEDLNFKIEYELIAGETYFFAARFLEESTAGSFPVKLIKYFDNQLQAQAKDDISDFFAAPGGSVTLEVEVSALDTEGITYQWYGYQPVYDEEGNYLYNKDVPIAGETNSTLTLSDIRDYTEVYCIIRDAYLSQTNVNFWIYIDNQLEVWAKDDIQSFRVSPGESVTFEVEVSALDTEGISYQWYEVTTLYNEEDGNYYDEWTLLEGETNSSYTVTANARGRFICIVRDVYNNGVNIWFEVSINNQLSGYMKDYQSEMTVPYGGNATLEVVVSALDQEGITYQWFIRQEDGSGGYEYVAVEGANEAVFTLENLTESTEAYCHIVDRFGNELSIGHFFIQIENHLSVDAVDGKRFFVLHSGDNLPLEVAVTADDMTGITYQWSGFLNGEAIEGGDDAALTLNDVTRNSKVFCRVEDRYGTVEFVSFIIIVDPVELVLGEETSAVIANEGDYAYFRFVPEETATYRFMSFTSDDPCAYLYDADHHELTYNDNGGDNYNFRLEYELTAGETYFFAAHFSDKSAGSFPVKLIKLFDNQLVAHAKNYQNSFSVLPGDSAALEVEVSALDPEGITYQWCINERIYDEETGSSHYELLPIEGATGPAYTIESVSDYTEICCKITDAYENHDYVWFYIYVDNFLSCVPEYGSVTEMLVPFGEVVTVSVDPHARDESHLECEWYRVSDGSQWAQVWTKLTEGVSEDGKSFMTEPVEEAWILVCRITDQYHNTTDIYFNILPDTGLTITEISYAFSNGAVNHADPESSEALVILLPGESVTLHVEAAIPDPALNSELSYEWMIADPAWGTQPLFPEGDPNEFTVDLQNTIGDRNICCRVYDSYGNYKTVTFILRPDLREMEIESLVLGQTVDVTLDYYSSCTCFKYTPDETGEYSFDSGFSFFIYDGELKQLGADYEGNTYELTASETYYFLLTNYVGDHVTKSVTLSRVMDNHLSAVPVDDEYLKIVPYGGTAQLEVEVSADDLEGISYQWYRWNAESSGNRWSELSGETGACLSVENVTGRGIFQCIVRDRYDNQCSAEFTVQVENHVVLSLAGTGSRMVLADYNTPAVITASVEADNRDGMTFQWYKIVPTVDEFNGQVYNYIRVIEGATSLTLTTDPITQKTEYLIVATDCYGGDYTLSVDVSVNNHVVLTPVGEALVYVPYGESAELAFRVEADNTEDMSFQWCTLEPIEGSEYSYVIILDGETSQSLTTPPVTAITSYLCQVTDCYGGVYEIWFDVAVENHLSISGTPDDYPISVRAGETCVLTVRAEADVTEGLTYDWFTLDSDWTVVEGEKTDTLSVQIPDGFAAYYGSAEDCYGNREWHLFLVTTLTAPKPVLARAAGGVSLSWTPVEGADFYTVMRYSEEAADFVVIAEVNEPAYLDPDAPTEGEATYRIAAGTFAGELYDWITPPGESSSIELKLPAPVLTGTTNTATGVRVSWNAVDGAAKYRLLRKNLTAGETQWNTVGETTALSLVDTAVKSSNRYTYTVEAIDQYGLAGLHDETGRTCTFVARANISALEATQNGVSITWTKPAGATNFRLMRRADGTSAWTAIADVEGTSYEDTTAPSGVKLWYTVRALNAAGTGYINAANGTGWSIFYVAAPTLTGTANTATGVRVSWNAVDGAAKYRLLRKNLTLNETDFTAIRETADCSLIDTSVVSSNRYTYTVQCLDANGSACSAYNTTGRTCTFVAKANISALEATQNGVSITWTKPAGAANFRLMRRADGTSSWTAIADVEGTSYEDTTAPLGVKLWYTVRALNAAGTGYINAADGTGWSIFYVAAPTLTGTANTATGVRVSWNAATGAAKYRLLRKDLTNNETDFTMIGETTECSLIDTSVVSSHRYTYTVQCLDANGNICSAYNATGRTCTFVARADISALEATQSGVSVTWTKPAGAANFRLMRRVDGTSSWTAIADVEGTSFEDMTVSSGVTLWYTVRALNAAGTGYINAANGTGWSIFYVAAPAVTGTANTATGVRVSWNAAPGAAKYRLLRKDLTNNETDFTAIGETTECSLIDTSVVSSHRYTYTVQCLDANGNACSAYNTTGRTCTFVARANISSLESTQNGVSVTWTKPAGAANFRLMRRVDGTSSWTAIADVEGTSFEDMTVSSGVTLWYTVRALNAAGTGYINAANGTGWSIFYVAAPAVTGTANTATGVRVSWNAAPGAAKYRLLRKDLTNNETDFTAIGETTECSLIDTSVVSSHRYTYTVQCLDANGNACSAYNTTGRTCTYIAMAKITLIGSVSNGIKLEWSKPAGAKNFRIFRKVDGETTWVAITDIQGTSYTDTTAVKGVKYWYTVRAITLAGDMYINSYNSYGWSCTR